MYLWASLLSCLLGIQAHATDPKSRPKEYRVRLQSFYIDASQTDLGRVISCDEREVLNGIRHLKGPKELARLLELNPATVKHRDNTLRNLQPSRQPLKVDAAWLFRDGVCRALQPDLNGIGIDAYDEGSGRAVIYLAYFQEIPPNGDLQAMDLLTRVRLKESPDFRANIVHKFSASCAPSYSALGYIFGERDPKFVCVLDDNRGDVQFQAVREKQERQEE